MALSWLADTPDELHKRLEGTLLFVDVSGFTALTERLAARGKVGAEEISDVIGAVFGELLGVATSYGADLLKWGGDAVLLYFADPDSTARACRAAFLMSRTMGRIGRFRTTAGRVTLEVSIGAHSGGFDFYLLGDRHRELVVTGPAASETARMETIAQAGEVVVSPETARRLDPRFLGERKAAGVLLAASTRGRHGPTASPTCRGPPRRRPAPPGRHPGPPTRWWRTGRAPAGDRRVPRVLRHRRPHRRARAPRASQPASIRSWRRQKRRPSATGSTSTRPTSDPTGERSSSSEGCRCCGATTRSGSCAAVHDVVSRHPQSSPVGLRAGVNAGRVFVFSHDFGLAHRRIFSITGDAVNLAARVMGKAAPRQVLATEAALVRARNPFETRAIPPFRVKGKSEPVVAAVLEAPRQGVSERDRRRSSLCRARARARGDSSPGRGGCGRLRRA